MEAIRTVVLVPLQFLSPKFSQILPPSTRQLKSLQSLVPLRSIIPRSISSSPILAAIYQSETVRNWAPMLASVLFSYFCSSCIALFLKPFAALSKFCPTRVVALSKCLYSWCCWFYHPPGEMMKAPGKPGEFIIRKAFEADPKAYFRNLRGGL